MKESKCFSVVVFHYYEDNRGKRVGNTIHIAHADTMNGLEADMQEELLAYANWQLRIFCNSKEAINTKLEDFCVSFNIHRFKNTQYHDSNTWDCYPNRETQNKLVLPT
jgi:hypothetical protein